jgi:hypothetical protein
MRYLDITDLSVLVNVIFWNVSERKVYSHMSAVQSGFSTKGNVFYNANLLRDNTVLKILYVLLISVLCPSSRPESTQDTVEKRTRVVRQLLSFIRPKEIFFCGMRYLQRCLWYHAVWQLRYVRGSCCLLHRSKLLNYHDDGGCRILCPMEKFLLSYTPEHITRPQYSYSRIFLIIVSVENQCLRTGFSVGRK